MGVCVGVKGRVECKKERSDGFKREVTYVIQKNLKDRKRKNAEDVKKIEK